MVDEAVLGRVTLGLESTEKSFLGSENLDGGSWVLGQVGQAPGVGDEAGTDGLTDQSCEVGCYDAHLGDQVGRERFAVLSQVDGAASEKHDVVHVGLGEILTH